jgi:peptidoglycan/LPS O-acetylase OafA/YrhL
MIHPADTTAASPSRPESGLIDANGGLRHNPALDGLRGLAVVGVIAFHAGLVTGGYLGVDLFFVLSGFLITSLLLLEHRRSGTIDLAAFWIRRARRLLPAVIVVVAVAAVVTLFARAHERADFGPDAIGTLLYVANWRSIQAGGYWSQFAGSSLLDHTWSLAIEEQFYLVWPIVATVVLGGRKAAGDADPDARSRRLLLVAIIGAIASSALMIVQSLAGQLHDRLYLGTDTRAASVLLGASLACVATRTTRPTVLAPGPRRAVEAAGWMGFAALAVAWVLLDGSSSFLYRGGLLLCGIAATAVIACVTTVDDGRLARSLSWRPFVALGLVSYGLYLWHWPIFVWVNEERVGVSGAALLALRLALTGVMALLSYRYIEMPVRRGAFAARPALAAGVAMVAVLALASIAGRPPAPPIDAEQAAAAITPLGPLTGSAATGAPARVLILGDSVGEAVATGVVPFQAQFGIEARSLAVTGCGIARDNPLARYEGGVEVDESACSRVLPAWRTEVDAWRPDAVLVILGWPGQTERFVEGDWRRPCDPTYDQWYAAEVEAALDVAGAAGSHVAISTVPYYRPTDAPEASDAATDCLNRIYREAAARTGVDVVDLAEHVCPAGRCTMERDGVELRPDGLHFADASSVWAADWLLRDQWRAAGAAGAPAPA